MRAPSFLAFLPLLPLLSGCGVFAMHRDFVELKAQHEALAKRVQADEADLAAAKSELQGTRERLENALARTPTRARIF